MVLDSVKSDEGKEQRNKFLIGLGIGFLVFFISLAITLYINNPVAFYINLFTPVVVYYVTKNKSITKGYVSSLLILIFLIFMVATFSCVIGLRQNH